MEEVKKGRKEDIHNTSNEKKERPIGLSGTDSCTSCNLTGI